MGTILLWKAEMRCNVDGKNETQKNNQLETVLIEQCVGKSSMGFQAGAAGTGTSWHCTMPIYLFVEIRKIIAMQEYTKKIPSGYCGYSIADRTSGQCVGDGVDAHFFVGEKETIHHKEGSKSNNNNNETKKQWLLTDNRLCWGAFSSPDGDIAELRTEFVEQGTSTQLSLSKISRSGLMATIKSIGKTKDTRANEGRQLPHFA